MHRMNETKLQKAFFRKTHNRYTLLVPNVYLRNYSCELDLFGLRRSGYSDEIEIKLSVSDFRADFNKSVQVLLEEKVMHENGYLTQYKPMLKHEAIQSKLTPCNYFSFLIPHTIIDKCDVPDYAGLYMFTKYGRVKQVRAAPLLHRTKLSAESNYHVASKMAMRHWYK